MHYALTRSLRVRESVLGIRGSLITHTHTHALCMAYTHVYSCGGISITLTTNCIRNRLDWNGVGLHCIAYCTYLHFYNSLFVERIAKYSCLIIVVCFLLLSEDKQLDERRGGQAAIERDQYSKLSNNDRAGSVSWSVGRFLCFGFDCS